MRYFIYFAFDYSIIDIPVGLFNCYRSGFLYIFIFNVLFEFNVFDYSIIDILVGLFNCYRSRFLYIFTFNVLFEFNVEFILHVFSV